jgi:hypothetical protein
MMSEDERGAETCVPEVEFASSGTHLVVGVFHIPPGRRIKKMCVCVLLHVCASVHT